MFKGMDLGSNILGISPGVEVGLGIQVFLHLNPLASKPACISARLHPSSCTSKPVRVQARLHPSFCTSKHWGRPQAYLAHCFSKGIFQKVLKANKLGQNGVWKRKKNL